MSARLTSEFWVSAYVKRRDLSMVACYVLHRGDAGAGAIWIKLNTLDGQAKLLARQYDYETDQRVWRDLAAGPEAEIDAQIARERARDRDLWVIEVADAAARHGLEDEGYGVAAPADRSAADALFKAGR